MFKKIQLICLMLFVAFLPFMASAGDYGLATATEKAGLPKAVNLMDMVASIIGGALSLIGVIFLILFIYGGFLWMTSAGDPKKSGKAKDILTNAFIGLILIFSAYFITRFVINQLTDASQVTPSGATNTTFTQETEGLLSGDSIAPEEVVDVPATPGE